MGRSDGNGGPPDDELAVLTRILPPALREALEAHDLASLLEVILDLGRLPEARFPDRVLVLDADPVRSQDLDHVLRQVGEFTDDNRAGLERTLHRVSAIRNRRGEIVGLTLRVGRAVFGTIDVLRDLVDTGRNLLLMGPPGVGKTTRLREMARVLADELGRRVIVVDTSNEIGGDGDVPHPGIGAARRMQVPHPERQHRVMIEAVENHMPEVVIVDEIGTEAEAAAARTIAERGVQLIGTAHGNTLENLVLNPTLSDLVGGVATVTLGDEEARRRGTSKTVSERRAAPTFDILVELVWRDEVVVHRDVATAVDRLLAGGDPGGERRLVGAGGEVRVEPAQAAEATQPARRPPLPAERRGPVGLFAYAVSPHLLERVVRELRLDARVVQRPEQADLVVTLRSRADDPRVRRLVEQLGLPVHAVKRSTSAQLRRLLQSVFDIVGGVEEEAVRDAVQEAEHAIQRVLLEGVEVALTPRTSTLRKVQHRMASRFHLVAESVGTEPRRHLVIHPPEA